MRAAHLPGGQQRLGFVQGEAVAPHGLLPVEIAAEIVAGAAARDAEEQASRQLTHRLVALGMFIRHAPSMCSGPDSIRGSSERLAPGQPEASGLRGRVFPTSASLTSNPEASGLWGRLR